MGFHAGNYTIPQLVAEIAAELAATADWEIVDEAYSGGYALRYIPDSTYMTIATYTGAKLGYYSGNSSYTAQACGIAVRFASAYDTETHAIGGTYQNGIVPLFVKGNAAPSIALLNDTHFYPVKYWVDRYGFILGIDNPYSDESSSGALAVMEVPPAATREYSDGFRLPIWHVSRNFDTNPTGFNGNEANTFPENSTTYHYQNLRPFNLATQTDIVQYSGIRSAYRADSNSKIYFEFPFFYNSTNYKTPLVQTRRWFLISTAGGLAVDDIISWLDADGVTVRKFIVAQISCPDTTSKLYAAIPYQNAYDYGA